MPSSAQLYTTVFIRGKYLDYCVHFCLWSLGPLRRCEKWRFQSSKTAHSVSLFTKKVSPKFTLTWDHWENCPIGQPSTKKWFLGPDKYGPCHKSKEKLGEIRSLLVTLPGTLRVQNFFYLYKIIYELQFMFYKFFCMTTPSRGSLTNWSWGRSGASV